MLIQIVTDEVTDVRHALRLFRQEMLDKMVKGIKKQTSTTVTPKESPKRVEK